MNLQVDVFDVWTFRKTATDVEYLLLHTSELKAARYFNGGRYWQIPSDRMEPNETAVTAIARRLQEFELTARSIWAAEHAYTIYNRRFECMQIIGVYAAEVIPGTVKLNSHEHAEYRWCSYSEALALVNYRGLKDGLRSTLEYITGVESPLPELQLL